MHKESYRITISNAYLFTGISQIFELFFYYLLYRYFSVDQLGLYSWVMAAVAFFSVFLNLGVEPILVRKFSKGETQLKYAVPAFFAIRVPTIILAFVLLYIFYQNGYFSYQTYLMIQLVGGLQILTLTETVFASWLKANHRQNLTNIIGWLGSLGRFLSGYLLIVIFSIQSIMNMIWGLLVVKCITLGTSVFFAYKNSRISENRNVSNIDEKDIGQLSLGFLRHGLVFTGINLLTVAQNRLDWLLVSNFLSTISLASYSLVNKFYEIFQMLIGVSLSTVYPWLCHDETVEGIRSDLSIILRGIVSAGTMIALVAVFIIPFIVQLLFNNKYLGTNAPIQIIMLSASLITPSGVFYHIALSRKRESRVLFGITISTILQLGSNLLLIPLIGIAGASIGMLVLALATLVGAALITQRTKLIHASFTRRIFLFLILSLSLTVLLLFSSPPLWVVTLILLILMMAMGWLVLFDSSERIILLSIIRSFIASRKEDHHA